MQRACRGKGWGVPLQCPKDRQFRWWMESDLRRAEKLSVARGEHLAELKRSIAAGMYEVSAAIVADGLLRRSRVEEPRDRTGCSTGVDGGTLSRGRA